MKLLKHKIAITRVNKAKISGLNFMFARYEVAGVGNSSLTWLMTAVNNLPYLATKI